MESIRKPETKWILIGHCTVDSGTLSLVDPCYEDEHVLDGWIDAIDGKASAQMGNDIKSGVIVTTYGGDGRYPVYGKVDAEGNLLRVSVEFFNAGDGLDERRNSLQRDGLVLDRRDPSLPFVTTKPPSGDAQEGESRNSEG